MTQAELVGIHHLTVNVRDLERSQQWYVDVLGFVALRTVEQPAFRRVILSHPVGGFILGLNQPAAPTGNEPFDERHTAGLDHFALQVPDQTALDGWITRLDELGVQHSEVHSAGFPGTFLITLRDPDNIQIELFVLPAPTG